MSEFQKPVDYSHEPFQRVLSNSYERGIIWLRIHATGMFIFIRIVIFTNFILTVTGRRILIAPKSAPRYPGVPLEWEIERW